jgi:hypothetical protein
MGEDQGMYNYSITPCYFMFFCVANRRLRDVMYQPGITCVDTVANSISLPISIACHCEEVVKFKH